MDRKKLLDMYYELIPREIHEYISSCKEPFLCSSFNEFSIFNKQQIEEYNMAYDMVSSLPVFILFGSDGCGFNLICEIESGKIFAADSIGFSKDELVYLAEDFNAFLVRNASEEIEFF